MNRLQAVYLHSCVALVAVSGIVFAWMKYAMKGSDELAVVNHPLQPWMLAAHVLAAPLLLFGLGSIAGTHIWRGFREKRGPNRGSGKAAMWMIVPMVLSGYLIQVSTADAMRKGAAVSHWATSAIFVLAYAVHLGHRRTIRSGNCIERLELPESRAGEPPAVLPFAVLRARRSETTPA
jgi:hypothetical protein